jgi:hypothetical protein
MLFGTKEIGYPLLHILIFIEMIQYRTCAAQTYTADPIVL